MVVNLRAGELLDAELREWNFTTLSLNVTRDLVTSLYAGVLMGQSFRYVYEKTIGISLVKAPVIVVLSSIWAVVLVNNRLKDRINPITLERLKTTTFHATSLAIGHFFLLFALFSINNVRLDHSLAGSALLTMAMYETPPLPN